ncbi:MAG: T9SS type A sorting domain-containing protein, partial [Candidatus Cloacimonetes bacterium]|nr:T9SS type A sorting domain-containing protein [Candidatus Cloacimonadota bacterium]
GYPYTCTHGSSNPIPVGQSIFSGTYDWQIAEFNIDYWAGNTANIRFVFGSDGSVAGAGWFIDDVCITIDPSIAVPQNLVGSLTGNIALLEWNSPEISVDGYYVKRNGEQIAHVTAPYFEDDLSEMPLGDYLYCVAAKYGEETSAYTDEVTVHFTHMNMYENDVPIYSTELLGNYPNPFNPETTIRFSLAGEQSVKLNIYNIKGQLVKTLVDNNMDTGNHSVVWKGTNRFNKVVAGGIYFYQLETSAKRFTRKMLLLK